MKNTTYICNDGINIQEANKLLTEGTADLISFAKYAIMNPDLPDRIQNEWEINEKYDYATFFSPGAKGYTDWECYKAN